MMDPDMDPKRRLGLFDTVVSPTATSTIKDKFPIPIVYELHGAHFFLQVASSFWVSPNSGS